jgi:hypothetical protein
MIIPMTKDNALDALERPFDVLRIEEAATCDGELCGARPELALPLKEYQEYTSIHGDKPVGAHWHIVASREHLGARHHFFRVF